VLYPVKAALDRAAVQLAGSQLDVGLTHLAQAQQHISEARDLLDRGDATPEDVTIAFDAATASTTRAQEILLGVYRSQGRPDALTELADFMTRARPQVDAMRARVPVQSLASWQRLRDLLGQGELTVLRELAACGTCGDRAAEARAALLTLVAAMVANTADSTTSTGLPLPAVPGAPVPAATLPRVPLPGAPLPTTAGTLPLPGVSVSGGGVTLPGATVNLPSAGITSTGAGLGGGGVTLPGSTLSLPGVSISSTGVVVGGGGITVSSLATVPLPSVSIGLGGVK
jgi:hypothetical protein